MTTLIFYVWVCVHPLEPGAAQEEWARDGAAMTIELRRDDDPPGKDQACERIAGPLQVLRRTANGEG